MYRVIAIVGGALVLAGCSTMGDLFKPAPTMDTIRFESTPPGAEAKTSTGQSCRTPCALAMPANQPFTVEFSLTGYQPASEQVELVSIDDATTKLQPNPVVSQLAPVTPPPKAKPKPKKRVVRKKVAPKPKPPAAPPAAAAPAPAPQAQPAPPPMMAPAPQSPSPWPQQ
jgi:outer membrane biosynthesis protein TonB